ncbi:GTP-binding protein [Rubrivivax gelatinosus]|nr:GTP-binding protein [Rubrivivax gelatinosus]
MTTVRLSLVSHTNVGKTTLARTLLGRDIGEVRDAPHVTEFAEMHPLVQSPAGDVLELWDTPGFGDTVRLVRRLRRDGSPVGWFLSEVWDRWRDRPFWATQQALRHVRDTSDLVLYLVNAAESPEAAGYVAAEMELLAWLGKPVLVLLNQLGAPRAPAAEAADLELWRRHLAPQAQVKGVLAMDAFARCWVQEGVLLQAIAGVLDGEARAAAARLAAAWAAQRLQTFDAAVDELATSLARTACARAPLGEGGWLARRHDADDARRALADALDTEVRASTGRLLALHGIDGRAEREILERVAAQVELHARIGEGRAALMGGVLSGALAGLKADLASGGLTLGGGMLAGGLLGALGAAGIARGLNVVRGTDRGFASWSAEAMGPLVEAALLRYLAVAHFGRGRGEWAQGEAPPHWRVLVAELLATRQAELAALWDGRSTRADNTGDAEALAQALRAPLAAVLRAALQRLYPQAWAAVDNRAP